jgi:hypothetical protein
MNRLKWWFRAVGAIYVIFGIGFLPPLNAARLPLMLPGFDAPVGGVAYNALLDFSFMFGLEIIVLGLFLIAASRDPLRFVPLVWLVVALEAVRGVLDDVYMIARGYDTALYVGFIIVHLVVIGTGVAFVRQAEAEATRAQPDARSTRPLGV